MEDGTDNGDSHENVFTGMIITFCKVTKRKMIREKIEGGLESPSGDKSDHSSMTELMKSYSD